MFPTNTAGREWRVGGPGRGFRAIRPPGKEQIALLPYAAFDQLAPIPCYHTAFVLSPSNAAIRVPRFVPERCGVGSAPAQNYCFTPAAVRDYLHGYPPAKFVCLSLHLLRVRNITRSNSKVPYSKPAPTGLMPPLAVSRRDASFTHSRVKYAVCAVCRRGIIVSLWHACQSRGTRSFSKSYVACRSFDLVVWRICRSRVTVVARVRSTHAWWLCGCG